MATVPDMHMRISVHGGPWRRGIDALTLAGLGTILLTVPGWQAMTLAIGCNVAVIVLGIDAAVDWWEKRAERKAGHDIVEQKPA